MDFPSLISNDWRPSSWRDREPLTWRTVWWRLGDGRKWWTQLGISGWDLCGFMMIWYDLWMIYDDLKSVDVHFPKCGISMDFIDLLCLWSIWICLKLWDEASTCLWLWGQADEGCTGVPPNTIWPWELGYTWGKVGCQPPYLDRSIPVRGSYERFFPIFPRCRFIITYHDLSRFIYTMNLSIFWWSMIKYDQSWQMHPDVGSHHAVVPLGPYGWNEAGGFTMHRTYRTD